MDNHGFCRTLYADVKFAASSLVSLGLERQDQTANIDEGGPKPVRVLKSYGRPQVGQTFQGVPERFRKNIFQKTRITEEDGIQIFNCTTSAAMLSGSNG